MNKSTVTPEMKTRSSANLISALALFLAAGSAAYAVTPVAQVIPDMPGLIVTRTIVDQARDFELTLTNPAWDCHTKFSRSASGVVDRTIYIGLAITQDPAACQEPGAGVTFFVAGVIPVGNYVVEASGWEACTPQCTGGPLWMGRTAPIELDLEKLLKQQSTAIRTVRSESSAPAAAWQNGSIKLSLPGDVTGNWKVELFTPTGARLQTANMQAGDAARSSLALAGTPAAGVYFLRLHSPAHQVQTLLIPVGN